MWVVPLLLRLTAIDDESDVVDGDTCLCYVRREDNLPDTLGHLGKHHLLLVRRDSSVELHDPKLASVREGTRTIQHLPEDTNVVPPGKKNEDGAVPVAAGIDVGEETYNEVVVHLEERSGRSEATTVGG